MTSFRSVLRPILTLLVVAAALAAMLSPRTRDGTVVTIAPEVAGRVVQLDVADNQYVHKGDLLFVVDRIAVDDARAVVEAARDRMNLTHAEAERRAQQQQIYAEGATSAAATYRQALTELDLSWTEVHSPGSKAISKKRRLGRTRMATRQVFG